MKLLFVSQRPKLYLSSPRNQWKKKDDLQVVISKVKEADLDFPVQFVNYQ
jgi:uncharacterized protein YajQ (UPF0234 family)